MTKISAGSLVGEIKFGRLEPSGEGKREALEELAKLMNKYSVIKLDISVNPYETQERR